MLPQRLLGRPASEKVCLCRLLSMACDAMKSRLRRLGRWRSLPLLIALVVMLASYPYVGDGGAPGVAAVLLPTTAIGAVATNPPSSAIIGSSPWPSGS